MNQVSPIWAFNTAFDPARQELRVEPKKSKIGETRCIGGGERSTFGPNFFPQSKVEKVEPVYFCPKNRHLKVEWR